MARRLRFCQQGCLRGFLAYAQDFFNLIDMANYVLFLFFIGHQAVVAELAQSIRRTMMIDGMDLSFVNDMFDLAELNSSLVSE